MTSAPDMKGMAQAVPPDPSEVEALRAALAELVRLKDIKTHTGETPDYRAGKDRAWAEARRVLGLRPSG